MTGLVKSMFISLEGRVYYTNSRVLLFFPPTIMEGCVFIACLILGFQLG